MATGKRTRYGPRVEVEIFAEKLTGEGVDASAIDRIKAPGGLDLGAIAPAEIAMSIRMARGNRTA